MAKSDGRQVFQRLHGKEWLLVVQEKAVGATRAIRLDALLIAPAGETPHGA
jgi:hypothetical protein